MDQHGLTTISEDVNNINNINNIDNLVPSLRLLKHQLLYVTVFAEDETADDSVVVAAVVVVP